QADPARSRRGRRARAAGAHRGGAHPGEGAGDGAAVEGAAALGLLRMNAERTYLRVGAQVFPVYGDAVRGWSPREDDFQDTRPPNGAYVYASLDELFFALVNLCAQPGS